MLVADSDPESWSLDAIAAALRVALDDGETFERAGADLLWPQPGQYG